MGNRRWRRSRSRGGGVQRTMHREMSHLGMLACCLIRWGIML